VLWLVDGMNVIGSRPDGWWRDRAAAQRRLVAELSGLVDPARPDAVTVTVVFDGRPAAGGPDPGSGAPVRVVFAPGGPDAADHVIVEMVAALGDPSSAVVVTSDAGLARRVRGAGVSVVGVRAFRSVLEPPPA
jgi:predicted RNA-binding protein with PIN domain